MNPIHLLEIEPLKLNLGCGQDIRPGYVNIDSRQSAGVDVVTDVSRLDYPDNSIGEILASDILEHFPRQQTEAILKEWLRVLKPNGILTIQCPDVRVLSQALVSGQITTQEFSRRIYGGQDYEGNFHHAGFDMEGMKRTLESLGLNTMQAETSNGNLLLSGQKKAPKRASTRVGVKRILFLRNRKNVPSSYNFALNYGWVQCGIDAGLYESYDWYIDDIPTGERFNEYLAEYEIDCIVSLCASESLFIEFNAMEWLPILYKADVPVILRASDGCYHSWREPFYQIWDYILYNCADKDGGYPENGAFIPWCIDTSKNKPVWGGDQIIMACSTGAAYPLRQALRDLNKDSGGSLFLDMCNMADDLKGDKYIEALQSARAIIATGSIPSPETKGKVIEAAANGALVITSPTSNLERYFSEDQVFVFKTGNEFVEMCRRVQEMPMDEVIERQKAAYEHVSQNHDCLGFINNHILQAIEIATTRELNGCLSS